MRHHRPIVVAAKFLLAALVFFTAASTRAIGLPGGSQVRLDEIRAEAAELKRLAKSASPAELRELDRRAAELLEEVRLKYPTLVPKTPVRKGRVLRVRKSPKAHFGKARSMQQPAAGPLTMVRPRLRVSKVSVKPVTGGRVEAGKKITFAFTVRNDGTGTAKKGSAEFLVTCDVTGEAGECPFSKKIKVRLWQDIPAGGAATNSRETKKGAVPGTYRLGAALAGPMAGGGMSQEVTVKPVRSRAPLKRKTPEEPHAPPPQRRGVLTPAQR